MSQYIHATHIPDAAGHGRRGALAAAALPRDRDKCPTCGQWFRSLAGHAKYCKPRVTRAKPGTICTIDGCGRTVRIGEATCFRCSGGAAALREVMRGRE